MALASSSSGDTVRGAGSMSPIRVKTISMALRSPLTALATSESAISSPAGGLHPLAALSDSAPATDTDSPDSIGVLRR